MYGCHTLHARRGFTLIELLLVVAILGIITALLVPNFLTALHKSRQKRTLGDMKLTGTAMMAWMTDNGGAAAAGAGTGTFTIADFTGTGDLDALRAVLVPDYAPDIPPTDNWNHLFVYRLRMTNLTQLGTALIVSPGRDGDLMDGGTYTPGTFRATDYDQDLVWADGVFVRVPDA